MSLQLLIGSGVVLEPFNGDKSRTLVSYLIHVSTLQVKPAAST